MDDVMVDSDEYKKEVDSVIQIDKKDATHARRRMEVHELTWVDESTRRKERKHV